MLLQQGHDAYQQGQFEEAKIKFSELSRLSGWQFTAYYNLGNIAVRQERFGEALGYYKRAQHFAPWDKDLKFNIEYVHTKLPRFSTSRSNWELLRTQVLNYFTLNQALMVSTVLAFGVALAVRRRFLVQKSKDDDEEFEFPGRLIFISALSALVFLITAAKAYDMFIDRAIVVAKTELKSGPNASNASLSELSEGLEVVIYDKIDSWVQVADTRGLIGWVPASTLLSTSASAASGGESI